MGSLHKRLQVMKHLNVGYNAKLLARNASTGGLKVRNNRNRLLEIIRLAPVSLFSVFHFKEEMSLLCC